MLLRKAELLRRLILAAWLPAVAEFSITAGWLTSAMSSSLPVAIRTGRLAAVPGAVPPLVAAGLKRRQA